MIGAVFFKTTLHYKEYGSIWYRPYKNFGTEVARPPYLFLYRNIFMKFHGISIFLIMRLIKMLIIREINHFFLFNHLLFQKRHADDQDSKRHFCDNEKYSA